MKYSVVVEDTSTAASSSVRRSTHSNLLAHTVFNGCFTAHETFQRSLTQYASKPCLADREVDDEGVAAPFHFKTYAEIGQMVHEFSSGLQTEHMIAPCPDGMLFLGIYMRNCTDWIVAQQAAFCMKATTVPLYDTLGQDSVEFIIKQTELTTIVCSLKEVDSLVKLATPSTSTATSAARPCPCPTLKNVILAAPYIPICARQKLAEVGLSAYTVTEIRRIGRAYPRPNTPPTADDIATMCYTSGTTGVPKGALISHRNLICVTTGGIESCLHVNATDRYLSFLPLPHIFERLVTTGLLASGSAIGFSQGDPAKILEDLVAMQPTILCAVPRLLTRIHAKLLQKVDSTPGLKANLFHYACSVKLQGLHSHNLLAHAVWDRLIFDPLKATLGMRHVRKLISGGAPLPAETMDFFRIVLGGGCGCYEGYGMTETSGGTTITSPEDLTGGHVGGPFPCCEVMLVDVPDMNYLHTDTTHGGGKGGSGGAAPCEGRGEICVRGPNVFIGYYKDEKETRAAFIDGTGDAITGRGKWLRSGDIGMWTQDGQLKIIDRKKNMLKLAQGEYVAVEKIENILGKCPLVAQLFLHGDSTESRLVAVVVPDDDAVKGWLKTTKGAVGAVGAAQVHAALKDDILKQFFELAAQNKLVGYEMVHNLYVEPCASIGPAVDGASKSPFVPFVWSVENNLMTPTMKLRRNTAREHYADVIQRMYQELNSKTGAGKPLGGAIKSRL